MPGCFLLKRINIPATAEFVGSGAFEDCYSLEEINVDAGNSVLTSVDGVLLSADKAVLIKYPIGNPRTEYAVPQGVKVIGFRAFACCDELKKIVISDTVEAILERAFDECHNLEAVKLSPSLTIIDNYAFADNKKLSKITFPDSLTSLGEGAFMSCASITEIYIPNKAVNITKGVFARCTGLETVRLPDGLQIISEKVFACCSALQNVKIPDSVVVIDSKAFLECSSLSLLSLPKALAEIGEKAFNGCVLIDKIDIPVSVRDIGEYAFADCTSLKEVVIPKTVLWIGSNAFSGCPDVTLYVYSGSYAEQYAIDNEIDYVLLGRFTSSERFEVSGQYLKVNLPQCQKSVLNSFLSGEGSFKIYKDAIELSDTSLVGTGAIVKLFDADGSLIDLYTVVVNGDANGDAVVDAFDLIAAELAISGHYNPVGAYKAAMLEGDDCSANIAISDYQYIEQLVHS